jgi:hypothetical protein
MRLRRVFNGPLIRSLPQYRELKKAIETDKKLGGQNSFPADNEPPPAA